MTNPEQSTHVPDQTYSGEFMFKPEMDAIIGQVGAIDPELLEDPATRHMIEMGAHFIIRVSQKHGDPEHPKYYEGGKDRAIMAYHNGQSETAHGHTSTGENGAGVPRNVLLIAKAANGAVEDAGAVIFTPGQRARAFLAASAHDLVQLCGRSADYDFKDSDEVRSADIVYDAMLAAGFSEEDARQAKLDVLATIFDPKTGKQALDNNQDAESLREQQLVACADLLSIASQHGAGRAMECAVEDMFLPSKGGAIHERTAAAGRSAADFPNLASLLEFIQSDPELMAKMTVSLRGQAGFAQNFQFQDSAIRQAIREARRDNSDTGINELFPGKRQRTSAILGYLARRTEQGAPLARLHQAAHRAGTLSLAA